MKSFDLVLGDCLDILPTLPAESVQTCVTSPPYWGLRDYGVGGQLGLEATVSEYVAKMVVVFREVRRVLRDDGTLWLNLGDSYAGGAQGNTRGAGAGGGKERGQSMGFGALPKRLDIESGLKNKDLVGIPWRVAFAMQADGWYLRQDIIWHKPNPMPESVIDRCTKSHEYIFLMAKSARYFYDAEAVREDGKTYTRKASGYVGFKATHIGQNQKGGFADKDTTTTGRNKRSVWTVTTKPYRDAHFATFPPDLIEPCVLAGSADKCCSKCGRAWERVIEVSRKEGREHLECGNMDERGVTRTTAGLSVPAEYKVKSTRTVGFRPACDCGETDSIPSTVLDPFNGAGTTGVVAIQHGRRYIGIELNPDYLEMARKRIQETRDGITLPLGI